MSTRTMVAVAPEPKPSSAEDLQAFLELLGIPKSTIFYDIFRAGRCGQAFMNALPMEYYNILTGSLKDPFHKNDWVSVYEALDYLLERI